MFFNFFHSVSKKLCIFFISSPLIPFHFAKADVIEFPDQELAREYVLPVFSKKRALIDRNVSLSNRFEFRTTVGFRTDEPIYHFLSLLSSFSFYWNESNGIGLTGLYFFPGLSHSGQKLENEGVQIERADKKTVTQFYFKSGSAPYPVFAGFLTYQFTPLYGKISITKTLVFNLSLYSSIGLGGIGFKYGSGPLKVSPASQIGIGQKFYFNPYVALDGGIDLMVYLGPNPISPNLKYQPGQAKPSLPKYEQFRKDIFVRFLARIGIVFLL